MERKILQVLCKYFDINASFIISDYLPRTTYCLFIVSRTSDTSIEMLIYQTKQEAIDYVFELLHGLYIEYMPEDKVDAQINVQKQEYEERRLLQKYDNETHMPDMNVDPDISRYYPKLFMYTYAQIIAYDNITSCRFVFFLHMIDYNDNSLEIVNMF